MSADTPFDDAQKQFLQGFVAGVEARRAAAGLPGAFADRAAPAPAGQGEDEIEGNHLYVGGVAAATGQQAIAREIFRAVPFAAVPATIERMLAAYLRHRASPAESFHAFCTPRDVDTLARLFSAPVQA